MQFAVLLHPPKNHAIKLSPTICEKHGFREGDLLTIRTVDNVEWGVQVEEENESLWLGRGWRGIKFRYRVNNDKVLLFEKYGAKMYNMYQYDSLRIWRKFPQESRSILPFGFILPIANMNIMQEPVLPSEMTNIFENSFPNPMILVEENHYAWEVNWTVDEGCVHFIQGWNEVLYSRSIGLGDILYFTYKGEDNLYMKKSCNKSKEIMMSGERERRHMNIYNDVPNETTLWITTLTKSSFTGTQTLKVPISVADDCFSDYPDKVMFMLPNMSQEVWTLKFYTNDRYECHIGDGWYKFAKDQNFSIGDKVRFYIRGGDENIIRIEVLRTDD